MTTLEPMLTPKKRLMKRLMMNVFAPTAASAVLLAKRPTTATSTVLNSWVSTLLNAMGIAKRTILPCKGP